MVHVELDVVFPAPDYFHGRAGLFREHRRFHCKIRKRLPPETTAEQRHMHGHVFLLQSQRLRDSIARALRTLRGRPHFCFAVAVYRQGSRRLHRGMRQQRRIILRLDDFSSLRKGVVHVAIFSDDLARLTRRFLQFFFVSIRIPGTVRALFPFNLEFLSSLHRCPGVIRQHGHAAVRLKSNGWFERFDGLCLLYTGNTERPLVINGLHTAAEDRRTRHARIQHSFHARILAVCGFTGAHVLEVVTYCAFADVAPFASRLQLDLFLFRNVQF